MVLLVSVVSVVSVGSAVSVAGDLLDDGRAEALGDETHRIYRRHLAGIVDQLGEIEQLVVVGRRLAGRLRVLHRIGVEAVVRDRLEHHPPAQLLRERGADVVGLLAEAWQRGLVVRLRDAEGDHAVVDRQRLRLTDGRPRRRRQLGQDLGPGHDDVVDVDVARHRAGGLRLGIGFWLRGALGLALGLVFWFALGTGYRRRWWGRRLRRGQLGCTLATQL